MGVGPEAHAEGAHREARTVTVRKTDVAALIPERVFEDYGMNRPLVGEVNPIVGSVERIVHHVLGIGEGETGQNSFRARRLCRRLSCP